MKTQAEIQSTLKAFEDRFGIPVTTAQQGSEEWLKMKLGVVSASNIHRITGKPGNQTRETYLCEIVSEICTGVIEELNFKQMEWGKQHEDAARSCYEMDTDLKVTQLSFVFKDGNYREGCSPDGIVTLNKGAEIKCPWDSTNYIKFLVADKLKPEWDWQAQYCMRVLDAGEWDVCQYDPRMKTKPLHLITVKRDEEKQKFLNDAVPLFIDDIDAMLAKIGIKFGEQWTRNA